MSASADLHDVWESHLPLGLSCNHCLHRALIEPDRIDAREGNLRCLDTLAFRCTKCGHRTYKTHIFRENRQVRRFMAEYRWWGTATFRPRTWSASIRRVWRASPAVN